MKFKQVRKGMLRYEEDVLSYEDDDTNTFIIDRVAKRSMFHRTEMQIHANIGRVLYESADIHKCIDMYGYNKNDRANCLTSGINNVMIHHGSVISLSLLPKVNEYVRGKFTAYKDYFSYKDIFFERHEGRVPCSSYSVVKYGINVYITHKVYAFYDKN